MKTVSDYAQFKSMHLPIEMDIEIGGGGKRLESMEKELKLQVKVDFNEGQLEWWKQQKKWQADSAVFYQKILVQHQEMIETCDNHIAWLEAQIAEKNESDDR